MFNCSYVFYYILIILIYDIDEYWQKPSAMLVKETLVKETVSD